MSITLNPIERVFLDGNGNTLSQNKPKIWKDINVAGFRKKF